MLPSRLIPVLLLTAACASSSQTQRPTPGVLPPGIATSTTPERITAPSVPVIEGLPHAVRVGLTVYIAGMVPVDSAGELVSSGDLAGQARQAMKNLVAVVRAAKGVPGDVVQLTAYLRDPSPSAVLTVRAAIIEAIGKDSPPALTIVGTTALPEASMQVMMSGTAQLRSEFPDRTRMIPRH